MIFYYSNSSLDAICNDEFYISESKDGAGILTRIWDAIKKALEKIKSFFIKNKNPQIQELENLTPEQENNLEIEPSIDVKATMDNIDEEINDSEKRLKVIEKLAFLKPKKKEANDKIKVKHKKDNELNDECKKYRREYRIQYKEETRRRRLDKLQSGGVKLAVAGVGTTISVIVAKKYINKIKKCVEKLNAKESSIKRIINVSKGMSPNGEAVERAEDELKTISRIIATLNQVLHELTSKIINVVKSVSKRVVNKVENLK